MSASHSTFSVLLTADNRDQGQYTKMPPRVTFTVQTIGTVIVRIQSHQLRVKLRLSAFVAGSSVELRHHEDRHRFTS